jgi:GT2 family glycosyltransferase
MSIGIITVTHDSAGVLEPCLASIPAGHEVIVVDNASRDASPKIAAAGAKVVSNRRNVGFGAACNQGARLSSSSHVLFLNPDAVLAEGALHQLEKGLRLYPEAAAFGPRIVLPHGEKSFRYSSFVERQGSRYVLPEDAPSGDACVDFIDGAAMLCDRELFLSLGGFDENLFLYFEDDDLSFRMRQVGFSLVYLPSAIVHHQK